VAIESYYETPLAGTHFLAKIIKKEVSIGKLYRLILILISVRCGSFGNRRFRPIFRNLQNSAK
jgi:hypothetical protein